ncbi:MAG: hypothetical protein ACRBK7_04115 [Acidimicrobiales bacterium]
MAENPYDNDVAIDPVQRAFDERIRREALRQLETVDLEDDFSRIERLAVADSTPADSQEVTVESILESSSVDDTCAQGD